jgi:lysophospholipase L1-like esterase
VRLELVGDAQAVDIHYRTATGDLGYRGAAAGSTFTVFRGGQKVAEEEAVLGEGLLRLFIPGEPFRPAIIYLPEGMLPTIESITPLGGAIEPASMQPRWLVYGDAVAQGWLASSPSMAWPSVVARKLGLDVCNLAYAGSAHGEIPSAALLADTPAEGITIAYGVNCWNRIPHSAGLMAETIRAFLGVVRSGHPDTPVVVLSPLLRPDAESVPNRLGATMADLRVAMEEAVRECMAAGDNNLFLVEGGTVVGAGDLADGVYPADEGHKRIAAAVGKHLSPLMPALRKAADERWAAFAGRPVPRSADGALPPGVGVARGISMRSILGLDEPPASAPPTRVPAPLPPLVAPIPAPGAPGVARPSNGLAAPSSGWAHPAPPLLPPNPTVMGGSSPNPVGTAPVIGAVTTQGGTEASGAPVGEGASPGTPTVSGVLPPPPSLVNMVSGFAPRVIPADESPSHEARR